MRIGVVAESAPGERRVALTPKACGQLIAAGHSCLVEHGAGERAGFTDAAYAEAGCALDVRQAVLTAADLLVHIAVPEPSLVDALPSGRSFISLIYPRRHPGVLGHLAGRSISAYAMDCMPRISRAQSMDVLSSQNNLAGYKAVIVAADAAPKLFPLLMTAAGTVTPARVLIYGAGVAGLQAIATARRLGAIVEVSDVRPDTKEQVESLGASFIMVEGMERVAVEGGYVASIGEDVLARQREAVDQRLMQADVVITTALVQGGKAPVLIDANQVSRMKNGAVIVDMATAAGGNCALSQPDATVVHHGVTIIGANDLAASVPANASELYAKNVTTFLAHAATTEGMKFDLDDEIISATLVTHNGTTRS